MINIAGSNTKLNILLNNTNKALVQVLIDATQDELKFITKNGTDLKSIMAKILKESSGDNTSNKALLALVKNNPTLNNLGEASTTIKQLIKSIHSDKNPLPIEKVLKNALVDIKDIKSVDIKPKLDNSGVFLESKIKNIQNPLSELKNNLQNLKEIMQESKLPPAKVILRDVDALLKNEVVKTATNSQDTKQNIKILETISKQIKPIVEKLQSNLKNVDPIHSTQTKELVAKLEFASHASSIKNASSVKNVSFKTDLPVQPQQVQQVQEQGTLEKTKPTIAPNLPKTLNTNDVKQKIQVPLPVQSILETKVAKTIPIQVQAPTNTITTLLDNSTLKLPIIKDSLLALQSVLDKSLTLESKSLLRTLNAIIHTIDTSSTASEPSKAQKKEISKFIQEIKQVVQKADVSYSKDVVTIFGKLKELTIATNLHYDNKIKEMLSHDLKATLLKTSEELQNSSNPNKNDLIKQMDKLVLQIDYSQLLSHLNNSSNIYLPITWDQLEGGNIDIKKDKNKERFYCDIELELKDYGEVSLKLMLFEKNQINIHIYSKNQELKELFAEHLSILRAGLIGTQIIPREIRFHDVVQKHQDRPYKEDDDFKMGFEVKG